MRLLDGMHHRLYSTHAWRHRGWARTRAKGDAGLDEHMRRSVDPGRVWCLPMASDGDRHRYSIWRMGDVQPAASHEALFQNIE